MEVFLSQVPLVQLALQSPTPEVIGKVVGELLVICLIPAIGVWRTEKALSNEGANNWCAWSLLTLFLAWIAGAIGVRVAQFFFEGSVIQAGYGMILILGFLVSTVFALTGLFARRRTTPHQRGFWMATSSLSVVCFFVFGAYASYATNERARSLASPSEPGSEQTFSDLNFSYTAPSGAWTQVMPGSIVEAASVSYMQANPSVFFVVIAEQSEELLDSALLASVSEANLRAAAPGSRISEHESCVIGGIEGFEFETEATVEDDRFVYHHGAIAKNGYAYQLIAWAEGDYGQAALAKTFDELAAGFRQLDPDASCLQPIEPEPPYVSPRFGYQVEVPDGLVTLEDPSNLREGAEYAAQAPGGGKQMAVLPALIGETPVEIDRVSAIMIEKIGWDLAEDDFREIGRGDLPGPTKANFVDYIKIDEKEFWVDDSYRVRVIVSGGAAYLVCASVSKTGPAAESETAKLVSAFQLPEVAPLLDTVDEASQEEREWLADPVARLGVAEYEAGELASAVEHCELAARWNPRDITIVGNLAHIAGESLGPDAALERFERVVDVSSSSREVRLIHARLLAQTSLGEEAISAFVQIAGQLPDDDLLTLCNLAIDAERYDEVLGELDSAIAARGSLTLRRWRGVMASRAGNHADAIERLEHLVGEHLEDADLCIALAEAHESADQSALGVAVCERYVAREAEAAAVLSVMGRLQLEIEDYRGAQATLEETLRLDPLDESARQLLTYVSGLLGRGDNQRIREPIDPVAVPEVLLRRLDDIDNLAVVEALAEETGSAYVSRVVSYAYRQGETRRVTERRRLLVSGQRGVEKHSAISIRFDPLAERVFVNRLVVTDEAGKTVAKAELDDLYVLDDGESGYDSYDQRLIAPVPGLKTGRVIEFTYTRESIGRVDDFGYEHDYLTATDPVLLAAVSVEGDVDFLADQSFEAERTRVEEDAVIWLAERPERMVYEPYQQGLDACAPWVRIADRGRSWRALGDEYLENLAEVLAEDEETRAWANRLAGDVSDEAAEISRLSRAVQSELTYQAQEFGVRGVIPNQVARIRRASSGDCKDHAVLLLHLLRSAGFEAYLALVSTEDLVEEDLPTLDQFDHMVVATPDTELSKRGWQLLDATNKYVDPILAGSMATDSGKALVLRPAGSQLVNVRPLDINAGKLRCDRVVKFTPNEDGATLHVSEVVRMAPVAAMPVRAALRGSGPAEQRKTLWGFIGDRSIGHLIRAEVKNLDNVHKPLELRCRYDLEKAWSRLPSNPAKYIGSLPAHWVDLYFNADAVDARQTPFQLSTPIEYRGMTRLRPPEGFECGGTAGVRSVGDEKPYHWHIEDRIEPDGTRSLAARLTRRTGRFPAEEYERFQKAITKSARALRGPLTIVTAEPNE